MGSDTIIECILSPHLVSVNQISLGFVMVLNDRNFTGVQIHIYTPDKHYMVKGNSGDSWHVRWKKIVYIFKNSNLHLFKYS